MSRWDDTAKALNDKLISSSTEMGVVAWRQMARAYLDQLRALHESELAAVRELGVKQVEDVVRRMGYDLEAVKGERDTWKLSSEIKGRWITEWIERAKRQEERAEKAERELGCLLNEIEGVDEMLGVSPTRDSIVGMVHALQLDLTTARGALQAAEEECNEYAEAVAAVYQDVYGCELDGDDSQLGLVTEAVQRLGDDAKRANEQWDLEAATPMVSNMLRQERDEARGALAEYAGMRTRAEVESRIETEQAAYDTRSLPVGQAPNPYDTAPDTLPLHWVLNRPAADPPVEGNKDA
jgi:hypothetical protein